MKKDSGKGGSKTHKKRGGRRDRGRDIRTRTQGGKRSITRKKRATTYPPSFTRPGPSIGSRLLQGVGEVARRSHAAPAPAFRPGLAAHNRGLRGVLGVARARNGGKRRRWGSPTHGPGCCLFGQEEGYLGLQPAVGDESAGHRSVALDCPSCLYDCLLS